MLTDRPAETASCLAGQLPGPPLKAVLLWRHRWWCGMFGRAIARPSIEGARLALCRLPSVRFGRAIARPSIEGSSTMVTTGCCDMFGRAIARPSIEGLVQMWWGWSWRRGLAGQLPGPPLKGDGHHQRGRLMRRFGRAIARPSIEGRRTRLLRQYLGRLAGQLPGPPLKGARPP